MRAATSHRSMLDGVPVSEPSATWARVRPPGASNLRRGAWYPVLDDGASPIAILDVHARKMPVPRHRLEIRGDTPDRFSIVSRAPEDPNPVRGTSADLGLVYAVCPSCSTRARLSGRPDDLRCETCGQRYGVDWDALC